MKRSVASLAPRGGTSTKGSGLRDARKLPGSRGVHQIIAGNGGSEVETSFAMPFFGFTEVRFHRSGKVGVIHHDRPVAAPYNQFPALPATAADEQIVSP